MLLSICILTVILSFVNNFLSFDCYFGIFCYKCKKILSFASKTKVSICVVCTNAQSALSALTHKKALPTAVPFVYFD